MPRFLRILFSGSAFVAFFFTASVLGRLLLPIALHWPGLPERRQARRERILLLSYRSFIGYMRALRLIHFTRPALPADLPAPGQPYLLISNHPSLIDVLVLTSLLPLLFCNLTNFVQHCFLFQQAGEVFNFFSKIPVSSVQYTHNQMIVL